MELRCAMVRQSSRLLVALTTRHPTPNAPAATALQPPCCNDPVAHRCAAEPTSCVSLVSAGHGGGLHHQDDRERHTRRRAACVRMPTLRSRRSGPLPRHARHQLALFDRWARGRRLAANTVADDVCAVRARLRGERFLTCSHWKLGCRRLSLPAASAC
jgi:hypothetical protein